jgi:hypothetical protein
MRTICYLTLFLLMACGKPQNIADFPSHWTALTTKNNNTYVYQPCDFQNETFTLQKATGAYASQDVGEWVLNFAVAQDGLDYTDLKLSKQADGYTLKVKNIWAKDKAITFNISHFDTQKHTAIWQWLDEDKKQQRFEMVTDQGLKNYPLVKDSCEEGAD